MFIAGKVFGAGAPWWPYPNHNWSYLNESYGMLLSQLAGLIAEFGP